MWFKGNGGARIAMDWDIGRPNRGRSHPGTYTSERVLIYYICSHSQECRQLKTDEERIEDFLPSTTDS
jgi:hypothetical protein